MPPTRLPDPLPQPDSDGVRSPAAIAAAVPAAWPTAIEIVITRTATSASCVADRPRPATRVLSRRAKSIGPKRNIIDLLHKAGATFLPLQANEALQPATNYWTQPNAADPAYTGGDLANAPTACEQLGLNTANTLTVTFGSQVNTLYMALLSVGRHNVNDPTATVTYDFDQSFVVDSDGVGYWSEGTPGFLSLGAGDTITMREGHGVLQFAAPVPSLTFSAAPTEWWHAFTFGTVPEPGSLALVGAALAGLAMRRRRGAAR